MYKCFKTNAGQAVDLLQQAAALGHRDAMYDIGMLYVDEKIKVHSNTL